MLLLYCPEASKAPVKMLYATAKASFVTKLDSLSLKPGLQLQCNDAAEVRSDIAPAGDHSKVRIIVCLAFSINALVAGLCVSMCMCMCVHACVRVCVWH